MLTKLDIFLSDNTTKSQQFNIKLWQDTLVTEMFASCGFVCTTNRLQRGLITGQELNEFLNPYTAALGFTAKRVLRHRHCCSSVNKVRVWCATWQLLQLDLCFITELKWASQVGAEKLLPWLRFSSAKLPTSGLQLQGQTAYRVSQQPNWTQTWSWNTHWTFKWCKQ